MAFATGIYSYGLCDYCGQRYKYNNLRKNWRGFMVCPDDYEPVSVFVGAPGFTAFQSFGSVRGGTNMQPYIQDQALIAQGVVGKVTVSIT